MDVFLSCFLSLILDALVFHEVDIQKKKWRIHTNSSEMEVFYQKRFMPKLCSLTKRNSIANGFSPGIDQFFAEIRPCQIFKREL